MPSAQPHSALYRDPSASVEERIDDLIDRMTPAEKRAQLGSAWAFSLLQRNRFAPHLARSTLAQGLGHLTRPAGSTSMKARDVAKLTNDVQRFLMTETRLGIPAIVHEEVCSGVMARESVTYPQAIGIGSTWDPELNRRLAESVRIQMRAMGSHQGLAPVLDVVRDPRWGRTEETYGEDPYLVAQMGAAFVRGLQGESLSGGVIATAKHLVGYGASEGGLNWAPAHVPPRLLREVYLYPFEVAVREAGLESVMAGYHEVDGVPCHADRTLTTTILRDEWGFAGTVVSDYFAVEHLRSYHQLAASKEEAAGLALDAGVDVELPATDAYGGPLADALDAEQVKVDRLDSAVARVLRHKFGLGLFEDPYVDESAVDRAVMTSEQRTLALEIARRSIILLKNDAAILPLDRDVRSVALIGPSADEARHLLGDYSFAAHAETLAAARSQGELLSGTMAIPEDLEIDQHVDGLQTIRDALADRLGDRLRYAVGCEIDSSSTADFVDAVEAATNADIAIMVLGDRSGLTTDATSGESRDRASLDLPGVQEDLVRAVAATGTPIVAVLVAGRPVGSDFLHAHSSAVLMAWLPGECGARAITETLFGDSNPSGKLPISYPRGVGQIPVYYGHKSSGGRSHWHGDYVDMPTSPRYVFGHGLTYTTFMTEQANVSQSEVIAGEGLEVTGIVANTGHRAGEEVIQLYIRDPRASVTRPVLELKGFARVSAEAGERKSVLFQLPTGLLGFYDHHMEYAVEPGEIKIYLGFASDALTPAGTVTISATRDGRPVAKAYGGSVVIEPTTTTD